MNPVSARLLNQQLVCPQFRNPADVVSWFGAIQAQDIRSMQWAVTMRTPKPSYAAFRSAFDSGAIIRAHLLRCTWQLVSGEDYHWIRTLCRDKGLAAMNGWTKSMGFTIEGGEKEKSLAIIEGTLRQSGQATEDTLVAALRAGGIPEEHLQYGHPIRMAELEGLICSGTLGERSTYVLVRDRLPAPSGFNREEALGMLARKYFRSHAPATFEDFLWWSGLNAGDCRTGMEIMGNGLFMERWKGREFYMHKECRSRGFRSGSLQFLPAYDEYLIGYKSRDISLHPAYSHHAHNHYGIFKHVVALDGEIVGNWTPSAKDGRITVFKADTAIPPELADRQLEVFHKAREARANL